MLTYRFDRFDYGISSIDRLQSMALFNVDCVRRDTSGDFSGLPSERGSKTDFYTLLVVQLICFLSISVWLFYVYYFLNLVISYQNYKNRVCIQYSIKLRTIYFPLTGTSLSLKQAIGDFSSTLNLNKLTWSSSVSALRSANVNCSAINRLEEFVMEPDASSRMRMSRGAPSALTYHGRSRQSYMSDSLLYGRVNMSGHSAAERNIEHFTQ